MSTVTTMTTGLRRSALEAFACCPLKFKAIYLDGLTEMQDASRRGSTFHLAAELYIKSLRAAGEKADPDLARSALDEALITLPLPPAEWEDVEGLWWRWVEAFELDLNAFVALEAKQVARLGLTWTPDLVYTDGPDILKLIDFKTHWAIWTDVQAAKKFQARFYLAQARRAFPGFVAYTIEFHFVRWGVTVSVTLPAAALDDVDAQVDTILAGIQRAERSNDWQPTPGAHCRGCAVACPVAAQAHRLPLRVTTPEEAKHAAGELLVLEEAVSARREALRTFTELNGPVEIGGVEYSHRPTPRTSFPADAVVDVLRDAQIAFPLTLSASALKGLLTAKKYAHVREDLAQLGTVKTITQFKASRPQDEEPTEEGATA